MLLLTAAAVKLCTVECKKSLRNRNNSVITMAEIVITITKIVITTAL